MRSTCRPTRHCLRAYQTRRNSQANSSALFKRQTLAYTQRTCGRLFAKNFVQLAGLPTWMKFLSVGQADSVNFGRDQSPATRHTILVITADSDTKSQGRKRPLGATVEAVTMYTIISFSFSFYIRVPSLTRLIGWQFVNVSMTIIL